MIRAFLGLACTLGLLVTSTSTGLGQAATASAEPSRRSAAPGAAGYLDAPLAEAFDPAAITRAIRDNIGAIQLCYERLLTDEPTLAGRVLVRFMVDWGGQFGAFRVQENTSGSDALAQCVVAGLGLRVERSGGRPTTFAYPFVFAPQN